VLAGNNIDSGVPTGPTGYTNIDSTPAAGMSYYLWWKRLVGGDADPTVIDGSGGTNLSGSNSFCARTFVWRGCTTTSTPYEDATGLSGNSTTPSTSAIDTTGENRRAVNFLIVDDNVAWDSGHPPATWDDEVADATTGAGANHRDCVIYKDIAAAGTVGLVTIGTLVSVEEWRSVTLALIPPSDQELALAALSPTALTASALSPTSLTATTLSPTSLTATTLSPTSLTLTPLSPDSLTLTPL
jgi:hypothetical protein